MTRLEQKKLKLEEEQKLIKSLQHRYIDSKEKGEFRKTSIWKEFRLYIMKKRKIDDITGRPLNKSYNLHHNRFDSKFYTDLDEKYFLCLNSSIHDLFHTCVSETIKNPKFMEILTNKVMECITLNNNHDVRYFSPSHREAVKKEKQNGKNR